MHELGRVHRHVAPAARERDATSPRRSPAGTTRHRGRASDLQRSPALRLLRRLGTGSDQWRGGRWDLVRRQYLGQPGPLTTQSRPRATRRKLRSQVWSTRGRPPHPPSRAVIRIEVAGVGDLGERRVTRSLGYQLHVIEHGTIRAHRDRARSAGAASSGPVSQGWQSIHRWPSAPSRATVVPQGGVIRREGADARGARPGHAPA